MPSGAILESIIGADRVTTVYGKWPDFYSFEVLEILLQRDVLSLKENNFTKFASLRAKFWTYDNKKAYGESNKDHILTLLFDQVSGVSVNGFDYQNPINGLGIRAVEKQSTVTETTRTMYQAAGVNLDEYADVTTVRDGYEVTWGGTCMDHDVKFFCKKIEVVDITPHPH